VVGSVELSGSGVKCELLDMEKHLVYERIKGKS
jgi:hypothetical protein